MISVETKRGQTIDSFQVQWDERVTALKEKQARPEYRFGHDYDWFYERERETGRAVIQEIWQKHGEKTLAQILAGIENLNLETQIELLRIGATDDAKYLVGALNSISLPVEGENRGRNRDYWLQKTSYRSLVDHMLGQKFPGQDPAEFEAKLPTPEKHVYWEPISVLKVALERGPQAMVRIFELISPEEFSLTNFEKRLELELKARETADQPV